jgi:hypothetical protein
MSKDAYEPNSIDATLARIIANQEAADRKSDAILDQVTRTNGRVTKLETWRDLITAKVATVSAAIAAAFSGLMWAVKYYLAKLFG